APSGAGTPKVPSTPRTSSTPLAPSTPRTSSTPVAPSTPVFQTATHGSFTLELPATSSTPLVNVDDDDIREPPTPE
ncbi:hypothetical protein AUEXF2481DRAFT_54164, partial [Aureobasidium subglaciale EXF-2481]